MVYAVVHFDYHPEVSATTPQGPKQVLLIVGCGNNNASVR
jgi:hypothetical protein